MKNFDVLTPLPGPAGRRERFMSDVSTHFVRLVNSVHQGIAVGTLRHSDAYLTALHNGVGFGYLRAKVLERQQVVAPRKEIFIPEHQFVGYGMEGWSSLNY